MAQIVRAPKEFGMGLLYLVIALAGLWYAADYPVGTTARMGPGYLPVLVCVLLLVFGAVSVFRALRLDGEAIGAVAWRPLLLILLGVNVFAALSERAGLIPAIVALVLVSAAASREFRFQWTACLGLVVLVAFCSLVFIEGLGVPLPLLGTWFGN